jgi:hypothetical protein
MPTPQSRRDYTSSSRTGRHEQQLQKETFPATILGPIPLNTHNHMTVLDSIIEFYLSKFSFVDGKDALQ